LPVVADLARLHGAEVLLVHVVTESPATAVLSDPQDIQLARSLASRLQGNAEGYLTRLRERMIHEVTSVQTLVLRRLEERQSLVDIASQRGADMIVLAAHGSTCNADRPFGSVASYLLAHGRLPIFVVQDVPNGGGIAQSGGNGHAHHVARVPLSTRPPEGD
jgi:nucleotide-binding universal stress UspA family protein